VGCSAVGNVIGSGINAWSAQQAAKTQASTARYAADLQLKEQNQVRADLAPYNTAGTTATNELSSMFSGSDPNHAAELTALQDTPGYQFALSQGLKSTQNSAAARGLGTSGAALKGAASYAEGLAQNTYQANLLNPLQSLATLGESAASQTGNLGTQGVANAGAGIIGAGNAGAAGIVGAGNAAASAFSAAGGAPLNYQLYSQLASGNNANGFYNDSGSIPGGGTGMVAGGQGGGQLYGNAP
jgi:hypothetical protein